MYWEGKVGTFDLTPTSITQQFGLTFTFGNQYTFGNANGAGDDVTDNGTSIDGAANVPFFDPPFTFGNDTVTFSTIQPGPLQLGLHEIYLPQGFYADGTGDQSNTYNQLVYLDSSNSSIQTGHLGNVVPGSYDLPTDTFQVQVTAASTDNAYTTGTFTVTNGSFSTSATAISQNEAGGVDTITYQLAQTPTSSGTYHVYATGYDVADNGIDSTPTLSINVPDPAPTISAPSTTQAVVEDQTLAFSSANGNEISVADGNSSASLSVQLSVSDGDLSVPTNVPGASVTGSGQSTVTIAGTQSAIDNALADLTYAPTQGYTGPDTLNIAVTDSAANGDNQNRSSTVAISVDPPPPPPPSGGGGGGGAGTRAVGTPTANAQTTTTAENTADPIILTGTDPDSPALPLTYAITTQPADGTLSNFNSATGAVTYTPNVGYVGPDSFAFTDSNGTNTSTPATVGIAVTPPPTNNSVGLPPPTVAFDPMVTTLGSTVTLTGTVSAAAGATVAGVELFLGTKDIGAATLNGDGTWTYDFDQKKGFHTGITAVATDSQGLQTSVPSDYDLTTGVTGEPYKVIQDSYDASADFLGQTFFKPSGVVFLKSTYAALPDGGSSYTYKGGSFFDGKDYTSFTDTLANGGDLLTHVEYEKDGSHAQEIDANKQTVTALGNDTFADYASSTRFVFGMNDGEEAIYGFKATGTDHDTLQLSSGAGTLAQVLAKATSDGQGGTMLHVGTGETVDLINITKAELKAHHSDFAFGAGTTA